MKENELLATIREEVRWRIECCQWVADNENNDEATRVYCGGKADAYREMLDYLTAQFGEPKADSEG